MTPLLLLPGMMCDARLFFPQIAAISGRRPIMTAPTDSGNSIQDLARQVLAIAPPRFALAGLSMGGILAMELLRQAPDRVDRLALLDTNPRAELDAIKIRRGTQMEAVKAGGLGAVMRDEMKPRYLAAGPGRDAILGLCMEMAETLGPDVFVRQSRALRDRPDQCDTLRAVTVPTLALCGREDTLCPIERHETIRDLVPGATLTIIDGAGHLPTLERPLQTNAALARWLETP